MARAPRTDAFTQAYFEAALWSTNDQSDEQGGEPLDRNYGIDDFDPATRDKMIADCADFQERFGDLIRDDDPAGRYDRWELAGHDFWLTRNRHGAGFWDGDWPKNGDALTSASKEYGEFDLYVDDGIIYGPPPGAYGVRERGRHVRAPRGAPRASGHWTVEPGRHLYFDGRPAFRLDSEGNDVRDIPHVVVDGAAHLIAELFNREGVTPDTIYGRHMGRPPIRGSLPHRRR